MLTDTEKLVIAAIQGDIPIAERPYAILADKIGISEEELIATLQRLDGTGVIRRYGATLRHQKSGFSANAMVAWQVPEERVEAVGAIMAGFAAVSHCYRRDPKPTWPYNLYTMVHARSADLCEEVVAEMAKKSDVCDYTVLFSKKELKKTSMRYFADPVH